MSDYDDHIAVTAQGEGVYAADLTAGWKVGGGLNGGYLLGVLGSALRASLPGKPDPIAVSAHYLSASVPGSAQVRVGVRRVGGTLATAAAELVQDNTVRITALATFADLARMPVTVHTTAVEPVLPPVGECLSAADAPPPVRAIAPMLDRFEMRFHPGQGGWAGEPSGVGEVSAWFRLTGGREPDTLSLLTVLDVLPPVTFDLGLPGWAPTVELTAHVRARPAPGWLKVRHATRNRAGGLFEEDCEVWDSTGRLVAQSRQLALEPRVP